MPCHNLLGAFQHPEVVIGWYRCVAIHDTEVRSAPGAVGHVLKNVRAGATLGRQSVRNPKSSPTPARRPCVRVDGKLWAWCYTHAGSVTGWVNIADLEEEIDQTKPPLRGPGGYDFEVGRSLPLPKKKNGCGDLSKTKPIRTIASLTVYLRYSGRGTAFHYLHRGDKVRVLIVNAPAGYCFVEVIEVAPGSGARPGSRGWLTHDSLKEVAS